EQRESQIKLLGNPESDYLGYALVEIIAICSDLAKISSQSLGFSLNVVKSIFRSLRGANILAKKGYF
ncbi:MAG: hypothetical protein O2912_08475, partial [Proteobacteria bacterium]|nr:hypothetical protein [Pseudomonadota bacterium]